MREAAAGGGGGDVEMRDAEGDVPPKGGFPARVKLSESYTKCLSGLIDAYRCGCCLWFHSNMLHKLFNLVSSFHLGTWTAAAGSWCSIGGVARGGGVA